MGCITMFATTGVVKGNKISIGQDFYKLYDGRHVIITVLDENESDGCDKLSVMKEIYKKLDAAENDYQMGRYSDADDVIEEIRSQYGL